MARLVTTLALILLCFAGELERFAGESASHTEPENEEDNVLDLTSTEPPLPEPPLPESALPEPVRCRWCREMVICHPDGAVFDLSEGVHVCGLDKVLGHPPASPVHRKSRRKKRRNSTGQAPAEPAAPP